MYFFPVHIGSMIGWQLQTVESFAPASRPK